MRAIIITTVMLLIAASAMAGSNITGRVVDNEGSTICNAVITAVPYDSNREFHTVSNNHGVFTIADAPLGTYRVHAVWDNYATEKYVYVNSKTFSPRLQLTIIKEGSSESGPGTTLRGNTGLIEAHR